MAARRTWTKGSGCFSKGCTSGGRRDECRVVHPSSLVRSPSLPPFLLPDIALLWQVYGEEHYEVAHSLNLLGNLKLYQRKDYGEAERLYTKSLEIREK